MTKCIANSSIMACWLLVLGSVAATAQEKKIEPAEVNLGRPVDFEQDIYPMLDANCIACHNLAIAESKLSLEDVEGIMKGGKRGAAVVAKDPEKSLLYQVAARGKEPLMPPLPNKVQAKALTPQELGLLRQWILEGASAGTGGMGDTVQWQSLPSGLNAIYSVALSPWGRFAAAGRANQILVYDLSTGTEAARLVDPNLATLQREGKPMYGDGAAHRDFVHALAFHPNGRMLASGGYRVVKLWERPENAKKFQLPAAAAVTAVAVSADGTLAVIGGADNNITLVNLADGKPLRTLAGHSAAVTGLAFSPDGSKLVSASLDKSIRIWNTADGAVAGRIDAPSALNDLVLNKEGTQIISAGADKLIHVWNMPAAAPTQLATAESPFHSVAVSPDKKWLALAGGDGKVVLIDLATGQPSKTLAGHQGAVHSVSFSANSARLASGGADQTVRVWDVASGEQVALVSGTTAAVNAVALHPNGNQVAAGSADNGVTVWKLDAPAVRALAGDNGAAVTVAAVSPDVKQLAVAAIADGKPVVLVRDIASGNVTKTLAGHEAAVTALAFSADNAKIVSGSADKTARVWNLAESKELAKFAGHAGAVTGVAFNAAGDQVVSGAADNSLKLWNVADGAELKNFAGHAGAIVGVVMTANNQAVVSASADQTVRVWNPADGQQVRSIAHGQPVTSLAVSRDGARIAATGTDNNVKVYQLADGQPYATFEGHTAAAKSVAFSGDNLRLVSSAADNQAIVWDLAAKTILERLPAGKAITFTTFASNPNEVFLGTDDKAIGLVTLHYERSLVGNAKPITGLVYAQDGSAVFSASEDGTVRRFVVANGQQQFAANHGAAVYDLALSPNGQWLASAGDDKQVRVWNAGNGAGGPKPNLAGFEAAVKSVAFTGDSARVLGGAANNQVLVFNLASGLIEQAFAEHTGSVDALAAAGADGNQIISAAADKSVRSWSLAAVRQIAGHGNPVTSVDLILPGGTQIVTGSEDQTVRIWELSNGAQVRTMNHGGPVTAVAARADGQVVASAGANNIIKLWTAANGQQKAELKGDITGQQRVAILTEEQTVGKQLVAQADAAFKAAEANVKTREEATAKATEAKAAADKALAEAQAKEKTASEALAAAKAELEKKPDDAGLKKKVEDAQTAATKEAEEVKKATDAQASAVRALQLAEKGVVTAKEDLAQSQTKKQERETQQQQIDAALAAATQAEAQLHKPIRALAFSPDGKQLATAGDDNLVHLWDGESGKQLETFSGHAAPIAAIAFGANRTLISGSADKSAVVWDTNPAWQLVGQIGPKPDAPMELGASPFVGRVLALDFSRDGKLLATGGGDPSRSGELMIWDVEGRSLVKSIEDAHSDTVFGVEFSYDGKLLLSGAADKFVKIFDVATGTHVRSFEGHTHHVMDVSWKADGAVIASAGADNAIKVWTVETGEQQRTIPGYAKQVTAIQFIGIGENVVSCGGDKTVRYHRTSNAQNYRNFAGGTDYMYAAAALRDESLVIAGGEDGVLRVWNGTNGQAIVAFEPPKPPAENTQASAAEQK